MGPTQVQACLHSNTDTSTLFFLKRSRFGVCCCGFFKEKLQYFHFFTISFVLTENNLKIISTQLPEKMMKAHTLQQKYKPCLNCL